MQKVRKMNRKISAIVLSLIVAFTMVFTPLGSTQRKVSAGVEDMNSLQKWSLIATLLGDNPYFDDKPSDKTAAIYTAAEYYWDEVTEVDAEEFCTSVNNNFDGIDGFDTDRLAAIGENDFFEYNSDEETVTIKFLAQGDSKQCTYIGESEDGNTMYGVWTDPENKTMEPYYVALDKDEDSIVSYRKLNDKDVTMVVDCYEEDEDTGDWIKSYTTSTNKIFIPYEQDATTEAKVNFFITIKDGEDKMPVQFTSDESLADIFELNLKSSNKDIAKIDSDENTISSGKIGTSEITYEIKSLESNNVIYHGTLPCTVYKLSIEGVGPYSLINMLPDKKDSITLKAKIEGIDKNKVTYGWSSNTYNFSGTGQTFKVPAQSSAKYGSIMLQAIVDNEPIGEYEQSLNVTNCNLKILTKDWSTFKDISGALKVGSGYMLMIGNADWGWDYNNGKQSFYKIKFSQNGKSVTATDTEKNLKTSYFSVGIGAGGGEPNRILVPEKAGTITVTATIYRNGDSFRTVTKKIKVDNIKKTTLSSAKNVKGKKVLVKWKKNTEGNGYQIQYSTNKKFAKGNKTKSISKNKTTSYTLSKLTKKKTYYVRIRTAKKVSKKTYYSSWSSAKKVKINK